MAGRRALIFFLFVSAAILVNAAPAPAVKNVPKRASEFVAPRLLTASDIDYPNNFTTAGLVEFDVVLKSNGRLSTYRVVRDTPALTTTALQAIQNWTFTRTRLRNGHVVTPMAIFVVVNPGGLAAQQIRLPSPVCSAAASSYIPPRLVSAFYTDSPVQRGVYGIVV